MQLTYDWQDYKDAQQKAVRESDQPTYSWAEIKRRGLDHWCQGGRPERCFCGHGSWRIFQHIIASGQIQLRFGCARCGNEATHGTSMPFAGINWEHTVKLPVRYQPAHITPCERCHENVGCESHHWAPREIFGSDSWQWPTSWLCRKCHREWHAKMKSWRDAGRPRPIDIAFPS